MTATALLLSALHGLGANKLRAALTTLGIIIGTGAVIAMLGLGHGARAAVDASFRSLGSDALRITAKTTIEQGEVVPVGAPLSYEDGLLLPGAVPLIARVELAVGRQARVRYGRAVLDLPVQGVSAEALRRLATDGRLQPVAWPVGQPLVAEAFVAGGRFFTPAEVLAGDPVCLLGHQTALDLFAGDDPLDQTIWIDRRPCLVVGVLAEAETVDPSERNRSRPNEVVVLPISTAIDNFYAGEQPSVQLTAYVHDERTMKAAKAQVEAFLRQRHAISRDADDDFEVVTRQDVLGAQQQSARTFALLLTAMATVSLLVGGIGIMNVMLVSVTERTREIGVRLAIGARPRDIVAQFLLEAVLLSAAGGVLGVAAGVLAIPLAARLNRGVALFAPDSIPLALAMALLVGTSFGLYPALRAARLDPIEALRYE